MTRRLGALLAVGVAALPLTAAPAPAARPGRSIGGAVRAARPARAPFKGLTATTVHLGGRSLTVVVAKTERQRQEGLRRRSDLGAYTGMLFVFDGDTQVGFTMSTVPVALEIGFYGRDGRQVDQLHMLPCARSAAECPVYEAARPFRYAVETLTGGLPPGSLTG